MKGNQNHLKFIGLFSIVLILIGCNRFSRIEEMPQQLKRQWMMVSFKDFSKEELMKNQAYIDLSQLNEYQQYIAKVGCNTILLKVKTTSNSKIQFSEGGSTAMFCQDAMPLENSFLKNLPNINNYKVEGHFLYLYNNEKLMMKLVAADWD